MGSIAGSGILRGLVSVRFLVAVLGTLLLIFSTAKPALADQTYSVSPASSQFLAAQVGTAFSENLAVSVKNIQIAGNPPASGVSVRFTIEPNGDGAGGTFPGGVTEATVTSGANGLATAPTITANSIAGEYTVRALALDADPDDEVPNFFFLTNTPQTPEGAFQISNSVGGQRVAQIGTSFGLGLSLSVFDGDLHLLPGIDVVFTAPSSGASATFGSGGPTSITLTTGGTGEVVTPTIFANGTTGVYEIVATISGDQTTSGDPLTASFPLGNTLENPAGKPFFLSTSFGNQQVDAFGTYPTNLAVTVFDGNANYIPGATVTFTTPTDPLVPSATFSGGVHTWVNTTGPTGFTGAGTLTANGNPGNFTVSITASKDGVDITGSAVMSIGRVLTVTELTVSPANFTVYGQVITLTATVSDDEGVTTPTGSVGFTANGATITGCGAIELNGSGVAQCFVNAGNDETFWLNTGNYNFKATYPESAAFQGSASNDIPHSILKASTTTTVTSSRSPFSLHGEDITFTVTVSPNAPGRGVPPGSVHLSSSDGVLNVNGSLDAGTYAVVTNQLTIGDHLITSTYGATTNFEGSLHIIAQGVYTIPEVTDDPDDLTVLAGENATFSAAATGYPPPTLHWEVSVDGAIWAPYSGAGGNLNPLQFTTTKSENQQQYRVVYTNVAGSDTSASALLNVQYAPEFVVADHVVFHVGVLGGWTVSTDANPAATVTMNGTLPNGMTFDEETDQIVGTPEEGTGGYYTLQFTASNGIAPDDVLNLNLEVYEAPEITSANTTTFIAQTVNTFEFEVTGHPKPTIVDVGLALPGGLMIDQNTLVLTGIPADGSGGVYSLSLLISNIEGEVNQDFTLRVIEVPQITSAAETTFEVGVSGSFQITADGFPTGTITVEGDMPGGVTFDDTTNSILGTPTDGTGGEYALTITGTNEAGSSSQSFMLKVNEAPEITSADSIEFAEQQLMSFQLTADGYPEATFGLTGTLPTGVSFDSGTGTISGTPAAGTRGVYNLTVTAGNGVGTDGDQSLTLTIVAAPVITSSPSTVFTVGTAGTFTVTADADPAATLSMTGDLPDGVTFDTASGVLSGTPALLTGGEYQLTFSASNGVEPSATQSFTLFVHEAPALTGPTEGTFQVGTAGSMQLVATGYPDLTFSATGSLPDGLSLNSITGEVSGTPTSAAAGVHVISFTAQNLVDVASLDVTLTVNWAPTITSYHVQVFTVGTPSTAQVTATGFPVPTFTIDGTLPAGITFDTTTGQFLGTPEDGSGGIYTVDVTASNGIDPEAVQNVSLTVTEGAEFTSADSATFIYGVAGTFTVTTTGFPTADLAFAGLKPDGLNFIDNGNGTGTISGIANEAPGTSWPISVTAINGVTPHGAQTLTIYIASPPGITSADSFTMQAEVPGTFTIVTEGAPQPDITISGELPAGVTFDSVAGIIFGTPAEGSGGIYTIQVTANNGVDPEATQTLTLTVHENPAFTSANATTFVAGTEGTFTFVTLGFPAVTVGLDSGVLPAGVSLSNGVLSGTPTEYGTFLLNMRASNGNGPDSTEEFTLTVEPAIQEPLVLSVDPTGGVPGDLLTTIVTGGSGTGAVSLDLGASDACVLEGADIRITTGTGICEVSATKAADNIYAAVTSDLVSVIVGKYASSITVDSVSVNAGSSADLTATVSGTVVDNRDVTFRINGVDVGMVTTDSGGVAVLTGVDLSSVAPGVYAGGIEAVVSETADALGASATANLEIIPPTETPTEVPPTETPTEGATVPVVVTPTNDAGQQGAVISLSSGDGGEIPDDTMVCVGDLCSTVQEAFDAAAVSPVSIFFPVSAGTYTVTVTNAAPYADASGEVTVSDSGASPLDIVLQLAQIEPTTEPTGPGASPVAPTATTAPGGGGTGTDTPVTVLPSTGSGSSSNSMQLLLVLAGLGLVMGAAWAGRTRRTK